MSRNALVLEKTASPAAPAAHLQSVSFSGPYADLIRRLFRSRSAVALIGAGPDARPGDACQGIAAQLAGTGRRVVIVRMDAVAQANPGPGTTACPSEKIPNVWSWPSKVGSPVEFFQSADTPRGECDWLNRLLSDFDAVLLDCRSPQAASEIAAICDSAVLVVESGRTTRQNIQHSQRMLELAGARLAGCILMTRR